MEEESKQKLIDEFKKKMETYKPNWQLIINSNPDPSIRDKEAKGYRINCFCERLKLIRQENNLSQEQFGERFSVTKQAISKIENKKIKSIPTKYIDVIEKRFTVSPAYLLGLVDDASEIPRKAFYYFYERPNKKYMDIRDEVVGKSFHTVMIGEFYSRELLLESVTNNLRNNHDLVIALSRIFESNNKNKKFAINTIINISDIIFYAKHH